MPAADRASPESSHPIGSGLQCCRVSVTAIGSLLPGVRHAGSCSPVTAAGAPGMPCAGAARGPAGPGHGGGGRRAQVGGAGRGCQGLARGSGLVGTVAAVGLGGLGGDTEVLWSGERGGREAMGLLRVLWGRRCLCGAERPWGLCLGGEATGACRWSGGAGMLRGRESRGFGAGRDGAVGVGSL